MTRSDEPGLRAEIGDNRAGLRGPGFGVAFRKVSDRWTHAILGPDPGVAWAESLSPATADEQPGRVASPVFQEVQLHGPDAGPSLCLLLTGLFFKHHFSAAVTLGVDTARPGGLMLDIDVADRCRSPVESLAATYLVGLGSGALESADPSRIAWRLEGPTPGILELVAVPPATLAMAEGGPRATRVQVLAAIEAGPFTHRFRYGWRWASVDGRTR